MTVSTLQAIINQVTKARHDQLLHRPVATIIASLAHAARLADDRFHHDDGTIMRAV
jgi:hypothetical protein